MCRPGFKKLRAAIAVYQKVFPLRKDLLLWQNFCVTYDITNRRFGNMNANFPPMMSKLFTYRNSIIFFAMLFCVVSGCASKNRGYHSPPGYDFSKPYAYKLPIVLDEISGLSYYPKDSGIFAIQDEKGWLFKIHLTTPLQIERWKFSNGADYEDLAKVDSTFYILKSKGIIEKFTFSSSDSISFDSYRLMEGGKNEFETLYYDSTLHQLILICKNCDEDKHKEVSSWAFDPATNTFAPGFKIETSKIREDLDEDEKFKFKPSGAAIHPLTGELYIIASVNHALVILNKDHTVKNTYKLDPSLFKQPEGITFTLKGDLLISNEAAEQGVANLLIFKYNKSKTPR